MKDGGLYQAVLAHAESEVSVARRKGLNGGPIHRCGWCGKCTDWQLGVSSPFSVLDMSYASFEFVEIEMFNKFSCP